MQNNRFAFGEEQLLKNSTLGVVIFQFGAPRVLKNVECMNILYEISSDLHRGCFRCTLEESLTISLFSLDIYRYERVEYIEGWDNTLSHDTNTND